MIPADRYRSDIAWRNISAGDPVSARDWAAAARTLTWAASRGRVAIPAFSPDVVLDGSTAWGWVFSLWWEPAYQAFDRVISARTVTVAGAGGVTMDRLAITRGHVVRSRVTRSTTGGAVDFALLLPQDPQDPHNTKVLSILGYEVPRARIDTTTDEGGVDASAFVSGQPLFHDRSVDDLEARTRTDWRIGRRTLLSYAVPYRTLGPDVNPATAGGAGGITVASGSWTEVMPGLPVLARKRRLFDTTRTVKLRVFARIAGSGTGQVRAVSSKHGASSEATFASNFEWSSAQDLVVDCEAPGTAAGLQGGTPDLVSVEGRMTSGGGSLRIAGWVLYEDAA